jgi:hypothetical protein
MADRRICERCTTNVHLKRWICENGSIAPCSFCGTVGANSVDLLSFARHVHTTIETYFSPVTNPEEEDVEGESAVNVVSRTAGIDAAISSQVIQVARRFDHNPSIYDFPISAVMPYGGRRQMLWRQLKKDLQHRSRFFGQAREVLDDVFGHATTVADGAAKRQLVPGQPIYRARAERNRREATDICRSPQTTLCAPPAPVAVAGRMNAAGIRVFYGALTQDIAVAEVRPTVGGRVVCAVFTPVRSLRLLDLGVLEWPTHYKDHFDPDFGDFGEQLMVLRELERELAEPVQLFEEPINYLATQMMSEYVQHVLQLDGIAYRSAQQAEVFLAASARNIALFGDAALTADERDLPDGARVGLKYVADSVSMLLVRSISIATEKDPWFHYEPAPAHAAGTEGPGNETDASAGEGKSSA